MGTERLYRLSLTIVGVMILAVAPFHGLWHWFFLHYSEMKGLTPIQWDVVNLFNWAITCFLFFMALLTIIIARTKSLSLNHLRVFSALLFSFWGCRLALEFLFSVRIPFVVIPEPSLFLKIVMSIGLAILAIPEMRNTIETIRRSRKKRHGSV